MQYLFGIPWNLIPTRVYVSIFCGKKNLFSFEFWDWRDFTAVCVFTWLVKLCLSLVMERLGISCMSYWTTHLKKCSSGYSCLHLVLPGSDWLAIGPPPLTTFFSTLSLIDHQILINSYGSCRLGLGQVEDESYCPAILI